ncbi:hypothetical protein CYMTET_27263 [Cymbomonas tetramitiformis]|uniref:Uncharacterized protein n=1 Tax=Cymbomonas tetramitiformis TaxID=36881 RepID=A0AAE0FQL9_9CHLO|nr:hypothetical protein CYMTET_27263 [Cymbomonas tetramitiformis]
MPKRSLHPRYQLQAYSLVTLLEPKQRPKRRGSALLYGEAAREKSEKRRGGRVPASGDARLEGAPAEARDGDVTCRMQIKQEEEAPAGVITRTEGAGGDVASARRGLTLLKSTFLNLDPATFTSMMQGLLDEYSAARGEPVGRLEVVDNFPMTSAAANGVPSMPALGYDPPQLPERHDQSTL